ncbi:MAG: ribosome biogenesis GTPase Der [Candidatus Latescibacterota bacterium]|jgi:GTP-binding protein
MSRLASVAIVGRPNVGKSTLFNRITGRRRAIVHSAPGVTRDVQSGTAEWNGVIFQITDTGGLFSGVDDDLVSQVEKRAIDEASRSDVLVFVTDARDGLTPPDADVAERVRATRLPVLLVVNKAEKQADRHAGAEFFRLGFENVYEVSALHGDGVGDVLDDLVALLPRYGKDVGGTPDLKLAIIGMPNVGKSSLVNALVGDDANIVDERPGTTRDSIDVALKWQGRRITMVDTAGIKRKSRTKDDVSVISTVKSLETIERCDVAALLLDASRGLSNQDVRVGSYAHKAGNGILVCFNKWDLVDKTDKTYREFEKNFEERFRFMHYAPRLFVSALTRQRVSKVFELAWHIKEQREKRLPTPEFNRFIEAVSEKHPPPYHGGTGKIYYGTQIDVCPPRFALFVNKAAFFSRNYLRYLNNRIRAEYSFEGTVVRIALREKARGSVPN